MNSHITKEQMISLLKELENENITANQFYKLLDMPYKIESVLSLNSFLILGRTGLIDQILSSPRWYEICSIMKKYPIYQMNSSMRTLLLQHIDHPCIMEIAPLLGTYFLFKDEEFVSLVLNKQEEAQDSIDMKEQAQFFEQLYNSITILSNLFENGSYNSLLRKAVSLKNKEDILSFLNLVYIPCCMKYEKWQDYLLTYYNEKKTDSRLTYSKLSVFHLYNRMNSIQYKILEIEDSDLDDVEKKDCIVDFIDKLILFSTEVIQSDEYFHYLLDYIYDPKYEFLYQMNYVDLFSDEKSLCRYGSDLYFAVSEIEDLNIKDVVLNTFRTSLGQFIMIDMIESFKDMKASRVQDFFVQLAKDNGCIDYLEKHLKTSTITFTNDFISFMSEDSHLTRNQLLEMKKVVEGSSVICEDDSLKINVSIDKVKTIGEK